MQPATQVAAIKGSDKGILPVSQPSPVEITVGGRKIKRGIKIRMVNVSFFKAELYADLKKRPPTDEERAQGWQYPPGYCHFPAGANYGDEHFKQICAEQLVSRVNRRTGRVRMEWQQIRPRNEALDCRIYARAAAWDAGLDRMQDKHWKALEQQLKAKPVKDEPPPQAGVRPAPPAPSAGRRESSWLGERTKNWFRR